MRTTTSSSVAVTDVDGQPDALDAALDEARESATPRRRAIWHWVLMVQALAVTACYLAAPFLTTHLFFDREAMAAREAEVAERARQLKEATEEKRAKIKIQEEHLDPLMKQERDKRTHEVQEHVKELQVIAEQVRGKRDEQLLELLEQPSDEDREAAASELQQALAAVREGAESIADDEQIENREQYQAAVDELLTATEEARSKQAAGLDTEDREAVSERLAAAEDSLQAVKQTNRDESNASTGEVLDAAQTMVNALRSIPNEVNQLQRQQQTSSNQLKQQRDRYLEDIRREADRIKSSHHKGLLAHRQRSEEVGEFAEKLEALQKITQDQKQRGDWDQDELKSAMSDLNEAAKNVHDVVKDIQQLGDQNETRNVVGLLSNQQRQADYHKRQWEQLEARHKKDDNSRVQTVSKAVDRVKSEWNKAKSKLEPTAAAEQQKALDGVLKTANDFRQPDRTTDKAAAEFNAAARELGKKILASADDDQSARSSADSVRRALEDLGKQATQLKDSRKKQASERQSLHRRIRSEWQTADKQLNDKAARATPHLKPDAADTGTPEIAKVRDGLQQLSDQTKAVPTDPSDNYKLVDQLTQRSQKLGAVRQNAQQLQNFQRQMQNGIFRDETARLTRHLEDLARNIDRKGNDVTNNEKRQTDSVNRRQATVDSKLDDLRKSIEEASELKSSRAADIAKTLGDVPKSSAKLGSDATARKDFLDRVNKAQQQAGEWLAQAGDQAGGSKQRLAEARQQLRTLSDELAASGLSRQNAESAAALLEQSPAEFDVADAMNLEDAVSAAESLHEQIESDFQSLRAAELAASSGQSFEQLQRRAAAASTDSEPIEVPGDQADVNTVGDLNAYRKAMDATVAQTEGLAQQSRTIQRQIFGQDDKGLVAALQAARNGGQQRSGNGGRNHGDPANNHNRPLEINHAMTYEKSPVRTKRLDSGRIKAEALPGRRFTDESARRGWLYVDTWYAIGPWENHGKVDWSNVHQPEFEIDLARSYADGKDGRELRWQFTQNQAIRCVVPAEKNNSTYYAYTEVYFDQPREMLVAIATDDVAKVWVNDDLVWQDEGLSSWSMDEGFRRVRFRRASAAFSSALKTVLGFASTPCCFVRRKPERAPRLSSSSLRQCRKAGD